MNSVEKLTADLQDTARVVAEMASREHRTLEQSLAYMGVVERMNLLQREWATKVSTNRGLHTRPLIKSHTTHSSLIHSVEELKYERSAFQSVYCGQLNRL